MWDLGEDPAASAALKLTGNFWIVSQIELASQCLGLAAKSGIEGGQRQGSAFAGGARSFVVCHKLANQPGQPSRA